MLLQALLQLTLYLQACATRNKPPRLQVRRSPLLLTARRPKKRRKSLSNQNRRNRDSNSTAGSRAASPAIRTAPTDNHNFGHLFTDRSNEPLLNQLSIVGERALDPNATGFDWGFKAWFMYGSDARYTKSVGFLISVTDDRVQPDFPELYASAHIPIGSTGGIDLKVGKYADPMSAETIDPRNNVFYSHSYIFNFGVPLNDLGALAIFHVNKYLDLYAGVNVGLIWRSATITPPSLLKAALA